MALRGRSQVWAQLQLSLLERELVHLGLWRGWQHVGPHLQCKLRPVCQGFHSPLPFGVCIDPVVQNPAIMESEVWETGPPCLYRENLVWQMTSLQYFRLCYRITTCSTNNHLGRYGWHHTGDDHCAVSGHSDTTSGQTHCSQAPTRGSTQTSCFLANTNQRVCQVCSLGPVILSDARESTGWVN